MSLKNVSASAFVFGADASGNWGGHVQSRTCLMVRLFLSGSTKGHDCFIFSGHINLKKNLLVIDIKNNLE